MLQCTHLWNWSTHKPLKRKTHLHPVPVTETDTCYINCHCRWALDDLLEGTGLETSLWLLQRVLKRWAMAAPPPRQLPPHRAVQEDGGVCGRQRCSGELDDAHLNNSLGSPVQADVYFPRLVNDFVPSSVSACTLLFLIAFSNGSSPKELRAWLFPNRLWTLLLLSSSTDRAILWAH